MSWHSIQHSFGENNRAQRGWLVGEPQERTKAGEGLQKQTRETLGEAQEPLVALRVLSSGLRSPTSVTKVSHLCILTLSPLPIITTSPAQATNISSCGLLTDLQAAVCTACLTTP